MIGLAAVLPLALVACGREAGRSPGLEGRPLPVLRFPDLDGRTHATTELLGAPFLLNVWATWCPPCRTEMADLDRLHSELGPRGFRLIGVSADVDLNLVREFLLQGKIGFPVWSDPGGHVMADLLGNPALPISLLVSGKGEVRRIVVGERRWADGPTREWVESLLA